MNGNNSSRVIIEEDNESADTPIHADVMRLLRNPDVRITHLDLTMTTQPFLHALREGLSHRTDIFSHVRMADIALAPWIPLGDVLNVMTRLERLELKCKLKYGDAVKWKQSLEGKQCLSSVTTFLCKDGTGRQAVGYSQ
jgi:hypothetical protein